MGRRHYQHPKVLRTRTARPQWYIKVVKYRWVGNRPVEPKPERIYLGYCDEMGKRDAEKARDNHCRELNCIPTYVGGQVPFEQIAEQYRRVILPGLKDNTQLNYESIIDGQLIPAFGTIRIGELNAVHVQQWVNGLAVAKGSRKVYLAVLRAVWNAAEEWEYVAGKDPTKKIKLGAGGFVRRRDSLEPEQVAHLIRACEDEYRLAAKVAACCGARCGEVLAMRFVHLNLSAGNWTISAGRSRRGVEADPKTYSGLRTVPLGPLAEELESVIPADADPDYRVFGEIDYDGAQKGLRRAAERAGIYFPGFGWHTLRRTYATLSEQAARGDLAELVKRMGHASEKMTRRYVRPTAKRQAEIAETLQNAVFVGQLSGSKKRLAAKKVVNINEIRRVG
jgi:integrase